MARYAKVTGDNATIVKYPYSMENVRRDNPHVSFPPGTGFLGSADAANYFVKPVTEIAAPTNADQTHTEGTPVKVSDVWTQVWNSVARVPGEVSGSERYPTIRPTGTGKVAVEIDPVWNSSENRWDQTWELQDADWRSGRLDFGTGSEDEFGNPINSDKSETDGTGYGDWSYQLDLMYWDQMNGTSVWKDHITAVKARYPKS